MYIFTVSVVLRYTHTFTYIQKSRSVWLTAELVLDILQIMFPMYISTLLAYLTVCIYRQTHVFIRFCIKHASMFVVICHIL